MHQNRDKLLPFKELKIIDSISWIIYFWNEMCPQNIINCWHKSNLFCNNNSTKSFEEINIFCENPEVYEKLCGLDVLENLKVNTNLDLNETISSDSVIKI